MAFQGLLKQSIATTQKLGPFVDKTDGVTYEVGMAAAMNHATTGVRISKNGGAFGARNTATEPVYDAFGYYLVNLDATDTATLGRLKVIFGDAAVCLPCEADFLVLPANVYDSLVAGSDALDVSLIQWLGTAPLALTAQRVEALVGAMSDNVLTAAAINAGALSIAKFAADLGTTAYADNPIAKAILERLVSALATTGSVGKLLADNVNATISSRSSHSAADVKTAIEAAGSHLTLIKTVTDVESGVKAAVTALHNITAADVKTAMEAAGGYLALIKAVTDVESGVKALVTALNNISAADVDTQLSGVHGAGLWAAAGSGAITWTYTLTRSDNGNPIAGADVWVTTDVAGTNVVASGVTNVSGVVTFYLDAGTYYVWRQLAGYDFTNPDLETVS